LLQNALGFVNRSVAKDYTALDTLKQICADAHIPIEDIDDEARKKLESTTFARAQAFFGRPYDQIRVLLRSAGLVSWVTDAGLNVRLFTGGEAVVPDYVYAPMNLPGPLTTGGTLSRTVKKTLIGSPVQTQQGVVFRVLLDASPQIGDVVQLAPGTLITPFQIQLGNLPPYANPNSIFYVAGVRHVGDSRGRGGDWYTEITGVTQNWFSEIFKSSPQGTNGNVPQ
jgi:hypothetical protein